MTGQGFVVITLVPLNFFNVDGNKFQIDMAVESWYNKEKNKLGEQ